jgi:uncharacterized protein
MGLTGRALRLTVLVGADDRVHRHPLHHEIVVLARNAGLAGATVLRGCEGFGATGFVHTDRLLDCADDLPTAVVIVDVEDRIRAFLPRLAGLVDPAGGPGPVTAFLDEVEVVRCAASPRQ